MKLIETLEDERFRVGCLPSVEDSPRTQDLFHLLRDSLRAALSAKEAAEVEKAVLEGERDDAIECSEKFFSEPDERIPGCQHPKPRMIEWINEGACPICLTAASGMKDEYMAKRYDEITAVVEKLWQSYWEELGKRKETESRLALYEKGFPMQDGSPIPWMLAEKIYAGYVAVFGGDQSLQRIADRGGFGWGEVADMWRNPSTRDRFREAISAAKEAK